MRRRSPEVQAHWDKIGSMRCMAHDCGVMPVTIHHAHGGSMKDRGVHKGARQKTSDWLVLPVCGYHHFGQQAIDGPIGVVRWELMYGSQADMIDRLCVATDKDLWALAKAGEPRTPRHTARPAKVIPRELH